jgi:hypothetical protein
MSLFSSIAVAAFCKDLLKLIRKELQNAKGAEAKKALLHLQKQIKDFKVEADKGYD